MKTLYKFSLIFVTALAAMAESVYGQPPNEVVSDSSQNTAMGTGALSDMATGVDNTAAGYKALGDGPAGNRNTAFGASALQYNTGGGNTASGFMALHMNTSGGSNTATGYDALAANTTGIENTASGYQALLTNTTGSYNTATGHGALGGSTTGSSNTAQGRYALSNNTTGNGNAVVGAGALKSNTIGSNNTAAGIMALSNNTSGDSNIAIGVSAGVNLTTGSNNIDIGNVGIAGEANTVRIGTMATQKAMFIAGIYNTSVTGSAVVVNSNGQLGVTVSAERFKTAIAPMGSNTAKLGQLRPVTFHLKTDPQGALQYGLIAEEVAKVYPDLVIRDGSGRIDGVRYDELAPMLLNEAQQQKHKIDAQAAEIRDLKQQQKIVGEMQKQLAEMHAALLKLQPKNEFVAQR
jgi:Chaperone of endosialidase